MYCSTCGIELEKNAAVCPSCGTPVAGRAKDAAASADTARFAERTSYEYARTTVKSDLVTVATDCYESLGFELTGARNDAARSSTVLSFRRSRAVKGKAQLVKARRTMDDLLASIADLEAEKTRKATMQAIALGVVFALVLGIGMCLTMVWQGLMALGIVVGIVGIAGCAAVWPIYRRTCRKEAARVAPRIEAAYDSLATACEEAQTVLAAQAR